MTTKFLWRQLDPFWSVFCKSKWLWLKFTGKERGVLSHFWVLGAGKMWACGVLHDICIRYHYTDQSSINKMLPSGCWYIVYTGPVLSADQVKFHLRLFNHLSKTIFYICPIVLCSMWCFMSSMQYYVGNLTNLIIFLATIIAYSFGVILVQILCSYLVPNWGYGSKSHCNFNENIALYTVHANSSIRLG